MRHSIRIIQIIIFIFPISEKWNLLHSLWETDSSCDDTVESESEMDPLETAETRTVRLFFRARDSTEMDVKAGDVVTIICKEDEDFWRVRRGAVEGLVPALCFDDSQ